jgi:hypothetical protein
MITRPKRLVSVALSTVLLWSVPAFADISGNFTLTGSQTFTSVSPDTFIIGGNNNTFNLQANTATFDGTGNFEINSSITGSGSVMINMASGSATVRYQSDGNSYSGLTTVRSGTLYLSTPNEGNNAILGNLYIGGGPNQAIVTRDEKHNRELIADTSTITIAANGTLEFNRMDTGNSPVHESLETFSRLILDGGTLINSSDNTRLTTVRILDTVQLLSSSTIDLGVAMTMTIGNVDTTAWNPSATLTIKNWSVAEPIYVGQITPQQLSQIRFELPTGFVTAAQIADGQIVPSTLVPEASTFLFIPLLAGAALWPELRKRTKKNHPRLS